MGKGSIEIAAAAQQLADLRDTGADVTTRTLEFLSYDDEAERTMFADRVKAAPLTQTTVITCMEKISTNSSEEISVSRLVIGTESRQLMIVDSFDCSIVMNSMMPDVPVFIAALGLMDNDYRILVATRSGRVFIVKNGELSSRFMRIDAPPIGIVCINSRDICIGQSGKVVHSFHIKGKKNWSMNVGVNIKDMTLFSRGKSDKSRALLLALENGEIRLCVRRVKSACVRACVCAFVRACICAFVRLCVPACLHARLCVTSFACARAHIHHWFARTHARTRVNCCDWRWRFCCCCWCGSEW